jgi:hypothetical protein
MSQIDQFLNYLSTINESTIQLTKQDYQKICAIRDKVTELAVKVSQSQTIIHGTSTQIKETKKVSIYQKMNESGVLQFEEYSNLRKPTN